MVGRAASPLAAGKGGCKGSVGRGHLTPPPSPYKTLKHMCIVPNFIAYPRPPQKISKNYCNLHKVRYTKAVK